MYKVIILEEAACCDDAQHPDSSLSLSPHICLSLALWLLQVVIQLMSALMFLLLSHTDSSEAHNNDAVIRTGSGNTPHVTYMSIAWSSLSRGELSER